MDELAGAIADRIFEDAIGLGGMQRYIVTAYTAERTVARLTVRENADASGAGRLPGDPVDSEPPTEKGLLTQTMRHLEISERTHATVVANTFANLTVPTSDTVPGAAFDVHATGRQKTFVLDGAVRPGGRYIVEGSADGGLTWDILIGLDGTQVFFTADNAGTKSVDAIVTHVRVRSEGNGLVPAPPSSA